MRVFPPLRPPSQAACTARPRFMPGCDRPDPLPTPFTTPKREGQALNEETAEVIKSPDLDSRAG